jgi:asparagine synthase (glutamine-hydrolysing)
MCGIAGIWQRKGTLDVRTLGAMTRSLAHRGPDDEGYLLGRWGDGTACPRSGNDTPDAVREAPFAFCPKDPLHSGEEEGWTVGFGHRRLSILDLAPSGHQPMASPDGRLWITYNGEIYNYLEIRQELQSLGHSFRTTSDTEVILAAYREWGLECLCRFNGMWALALWDREERRLFCARDRFGVKPFYYHWDDRRFVFASEIKALLEAGIPRQPNEGTVYDYLRYGLLDHTEETLFAGVEKLPAGHYLALGPDGPPIRRRYWNLQVSDAIRDDRPDAEWEEEFRTLLTNGVRLRLRSDVTVGSCLSGGLDSSAIVCLAARLLGSSGTSPAPRLETFSACFTEPPLDERRYIHAVSASAGVEENLLYPTLGGLHGEFERLLDHQDEPFNGTGLYAQWCVMRAARARGVPVLLDGQGADEALAGYRKFMVFYFLKLWNHGLYRDLAREVGGFFLSLDVLKNLPVAHGLRYFQWGRKMADPSDLLLPDFIRRHADRTYDLGFSGDLGRRMREDLLRYSLPVLLRYEDRNSMAHSVESRLPFLDVRLAECIAQMPLNQKLRGGWRKHVMRAALRGILPETVRLRRSKLGFSTPDQRWMKDLVASGGTFDGKKNRFIHRFVDAARLGAASSHFIRGLSHLPTRFFYRLHLLEKWSEMKLGN